jgi:hypothetical protein
VEVQEDASIICGSELVEEFGFVPHCAECGEPQYRVVGSGMTCLNGHGGCASVPKEEPSTLDIEAEEPPADKVLPGTSKDEDIAGFLDLADDDDKALSRREVEEADEDLDIESILANFAG